MDGSSGDAAPIPTRMQPLVACISATLLFAGFTWLAVSGPFVDHDAARSVRPTFTTDINSAPAVELAQVPGLGPATAARIVEHRDTHGPFPTVDALLDVPGIGPATVERMRPYLDPLPTARNPSRGPP